LATPYLPNYVVIEQRLSGARIAPYRRLAGAALPGALKLYAWNGELAAAWWTVISDVEILIRNAMNDQLVSWAKAKYGDPRWYLDHGGVLSFEAREAIQSARRRATRDGRPEAMGQVVTGLSFGFWRFLLTARYERSLWIPALRKSFPGLIGRGMRAEVHQGMFALHELRNRIAHHEPIHNRPLEDLHGVALRVAAWVCRDTATWIQVRSRVPELLVRVA
jgi:hypothetical protein